MERLLQEDLCCNSIPAHWTTRLGLEPWMEELYQEDPCIMLDYQDYQTWDRTTGPWNVEEQSPLEEALSIWF